MTISFKCRPTWAGLFNKSIRVHYIMRFVSCRWRRNVICTWPRLLRSDRELPTMTYAEYIIHRTGSLEVIIIVTFECFLRAPVRSPIITRCCVHELTFDVISTIRCGFEYSHVSGSLPLLDTERSIRNVLKHLKNKIHHRNSINRFSSFKY